MRKITTIISLLLICFFLSVGARECGAKKDLVAGSSYQPNIIFAPYNLVVTDIPPNQIELFWVDNSDNETGFEVERRIPPTDYSLLATVDTNIGYYSDATVLSNTTYYYRVRAFNTSGAKSAYSNEASVLRGQPQSFRAIAAGNGHTVAVASNGDLWAWGRNDRGQLGIGGTWDEQNQLWRTEAKNIPTRVGTDADWSNIAAGDSHTLALKTNRTIWAWGINFSGELGLGDSEYTDRVTPTQIGSDSDWSVIEGGQDHSLAIKTNRTIWGWGYNYYGQLGLSLSDASLIVRTTPAQIGTDSDWSSVSTGNYHTLALKTNGTIWGCGLLGALGLGYTNYFFPSVFSLTQIGTNSDWSLVSGGGNCTFARKVDRTFWAWGANGFGQLGLGDTNNRISPSQIGTDSNWTNISTSGVHTLGLRNNGTIWSWGRNGSGELGLGDTIDRYIPTQLRTASDWAIVTASGGEVSGPTLIVYTIALKTNSTLWSWGNNQYGQLGLGDTIDRNTPTSVPTLR